MPVFSSTKEIENLAEFSVPPERGNPLKRKIFSLWSFIFIELRIYTLFESYCIVCVPAFIFGLLLSDPAGRICGSASFSENLFKMFFNGFLLLLFSTNDDYAQCLATILNVKKKKEKRRKNFA